MRRRCCQNQHLVNMSYFILGILFGINTFLVYRMLSNDTDEDVRDLFAMSLGVGIMYLVTKVL